MIANKDAKSVLIKWMAEREGFEPSVRSPPRSLSKGVLSTTQPSLLIVGIFGRAFEPHFVEGVNH